MTHNDSVTTKQDKPHSYEFGKPGARFKIYFNTPAELDTYIKSLAKWNFPVKLAYEQPEVSNVQN